MSYLETSCYVVMQGRKKGTTLYTFHTLYTMAM